MSYVAFSPTSFLSHALIKVHIYNLDDFIGYKKEYMYYNSLIYSLFDVKPNTEIR